MDGDREWCRAQTYTAPDGVVSKAKWIGGLGVDARSALVADGWCDERNLFNNHTFSDTFFSDHASKSVNQPFVAPDCLCCGPPKPRCFDSKLRLSAPKSVFTPSQSPLEPEAAFQRLKQQNIKRRRDRSVRVCTFIGTAPDLLDVDGKFAKRRDAISNTWADNNTYVLWPRGADYPVRTAKSIKPLYLDMPENLQYSEVTHRYFKLLETLHLANSKALPIADCDFSLVVDDDAYINLPAWNEYFSSGWLNPEDVWYMGPFSSTRIDRGMMSFAHGTTMVFSSGLAREASKWLPLCYEYFDKPDGNVDYWGDVAIGKCLNLFSVYALRPSKRLVMKNQGGDTATKDVLKKKLEERQCIMSVHKLDHETMYDVHANILESRAAFPDTACDQHRRGWMGSAVLQHCDAPVHHPTQLRHHVADFCSSRVFPEWLFKVESKKVIASSFKLDHIETATLCAEACLAMASPAKCFMFYWLPNNNDCHLLNHSWHSSRDEGLVKYSVNLRKKSTEIANGVVAGTCRMSTAVPRPTTTRVSRIR